MSSKYESLQEDRRLARRSDAKLKVYLSGGSWREPGTALDISRRGVFVETTWPGLSYGSKLDLMFVRSDSKVIKVRRYSAIVIRRSANGLGLRFCWSPHLGRIDRQSYPSFKGVI